MFIRRLAGFSCAAVLASAAILTGEQALPAAAADPCPDVEVIWARGTAADPGLGIAGTAFVDAVRAKLGGRSVTGYGVNYPASFNFANSAPAGAADATARIQWMADNCPATRLVLGGLSQGAGVISLITADAGQHGRYTATPLPPQLGDRVAAIAVFGNPLRKVFPAGGPLNEISSAFGARTIDLCANNDIFCSRGLNLAAHFSYIDNGMIDQGAQFAVDRLR